MGLEKDSNIRKNTLSQIQVGYCRYFRSNVITQLQVKVALTICTRIKTFTLGPIMIKIIGVHINPMDLLIDVNANYRYRYCAQCE